MVDRSVIHPPPVLWAQNKDKLFVTVSLEDCSNPVIELKETQLYFKGCGGAEKKDHEVTILFFNEVIPAESKQDVRDREIFFVIKKATEGWWPRLMKDNKKVHWLKTDFDKWKDQDDSDLEDGDDFNLDEMMHKMGDLDGGANEENEDSDDDDLPDLE